MGYNLIIRKEGSLLSKVLESEVTDKQFEAIKLIIDDENLAVVMVIEERMRKRGQAMPAPGQPTRPDPGRRL